MFISILKSKTLYIQTVHPELHLQSGHGSNERSRRSTRKGGRRENPAQTDSQWVRGKHTVLSPGYRVTLSMQS